MKGLLVHQQVRSQELQQLLSKYHIENQLSYYIENAMKGMDA